MLFTDLKPHEGPDYRNAHPSTVIDAYTRSARASRRSPVPGSTWSPPWTKQEA